MNTKVERRMDLDWMRVIAILVVFVFHSFRFFSIDRWHVNNPNTYVAVKIGLDFLGTFMMPFIFVVSGASLFFALGKGTGAGKFVKDKVLRLLVPLLVNVFSLCILQVYLDRFSHREFTGSLLEFLPQYFNGIYGFGDGNFALVGMHLWYLAVLFFFSLILFPLFLLLKSRVGAAGLRWFTNLAAFPGGIYLLAIGILSLWKLIDPNGILGFDKFAWNLGVYMSYFIYGFVIISNQRLQRSIQTWRWVSLAFAVAASIWWYTSGGEHADLASWSWVLTFLGFGFRYLNIDVPFARYASEAVLPFYILHQTVLLSVGYFVMQWAIPDPLKWAITAAASFTTILLVYEFLVRRINVLRVLFGMKPLKHSPQPAAKESPQPAGSLETAK